MSPYSDWYDEADLAPYDDDRADAFRCWGCELNIGRSGLCAACQAEEDAR